MTVDRIIIALLTLALLTPAASALDVNMTDEQYMQQISQLQAQINLLQQRLESPQIITVQTDEQLKNDISALKGQMAVLSDSMGKMEDRFGRLASDMQSSIENSKTQTVQEIDLSIKQNLNTGLTQMINQIKELTNPVRMNLPTAGIWLILTGAFLIWASRQYRLTEGARMEMRQELSPMQANLEQPKTEQPKTEPKKKRFGLFRKKPALEKPKPPEIPLEIKRRFEDLNKLSEILSQEQKNLLEEMKKLEGGK